MYNSETFFIFLGGIFSLFLTVIIIYVRQEYKRIERRAYLEIQARKEPEVVGDIQENMNNSYEYRKLDFFELLTSWGLQPLVIINFTNLFNINHFSRIEVVFAFVLVLVTFVHEFWTGIEYSKKRWYQSILLILQLALFIVISYDTNEYNNSSELLKLQQIHIDSIKVHSAQ